MVSIDVENIGLVYGLRRGPAQVAREPVTFGPSRQVHSNGRTTFVTALEDVSFSLKAGDRLGLVGKNGAGKTTLLKVLYGIYEPTSGRIDRRGRVDALFNINLGFRREASGRRNIELRGLINGWTKVDIAARTEEIIEFSELGDFIDMPFKVYSQGMAARLAFSIATSFEPEILLMDEWIGAGDPSFQDKARRRIQELTQKAGIVVLASHNHALLNKFCNKVLELDSGRITYFGGADRYFSEAWPAS